MPYTLRDQTSSIRFRRCHFENRHVCGYAVIGNLYIIILILSCKPRIAPPEILSINYPQEKQRLLQKGPCKGLMAKWDEDLQAWIVKGDKTKLSPEDQLTPYLPQPGAPIPPETGFYYMDKSRRDFMKLISGE